jgi:hypothetical protein
VRERDMMIRYLGFVVGVGPNIFAASMCCIRSISVV